jgi:hypothetical protein
MIIFYELAFVVLLIAIVVFCARPLVEAYSEKIKSGSRRIAPQPGELEAKVERLEAEVLELRRELKCVQESCDFALSLVKGDDEGVIELKQEKAGITKNN